MDWLPRPEYITIGSVIANHLYCPILPTRQQVCMSPLLDSLDISECRCAGNFTLHLLVVSFRIETAIYGLLSIERSYVCGEYIGDCLLILFDHWFPYYEASFWCLQEQPPQTLLCESSSNSSARCTSLVGLIFQTLLQTSRCKVGPFRAHPD